MFARFFIRRPIFAVVVSLVICIAGALSLTKLPVEMYPSMSPVQITVSAAYPGADARTVAESVAAPIEAQINGVDGMLYMTSSSSSSGQMTITVSFENGTDPDIAQVQVQNRVNLASSQLPSVVTQNGVTVAKRSGSMLMLLGVSSTSDAWSNDYVSNYANTYVVDAIKRVPGAGQAQAFGSVDQAMRIWLNPDRMASLGITVSDISQAVATQNRISSAGTLGAAPAPAGTQISVPIRGLTSFSEPRDYDAIIVRGASENSAIVRLGDVARTEIGRQNYLVNTQLDGRNATLIQVLQQAGANGLAVSREVRKTIDELQKAAPPGIKFTIALDTTDFVRVSINEVIHTLFEALVLVILIVYLFLQKIRPTLIAIAAIAVSLLGTFAGMLALGFTINQLTLFGMVLAIGLVVDDAIVVVENVERNLETTPDRLLATERSMNEVTGPVIATVLVLCAVFIPASFISGTTGQLYKQFAITIAVSVAISGFVALTLTPALCGQFLTLGGPARRGPFAWFNRGFDAFTRGYLVGCKALIGRLWTGFACMLVLGVSIWGLFGKIPTSFLPTEDQGYMLVAGMMPDATSLERSDKVMGQIDAALASNPAVEHRAVITGYSLLDGGMNSFSGTAFVALKPFDERYADKSRPLSAQSVQGDLFAKSMGILGGVALPVTPPPIPGLGSTGGFEMWIQGASDTTPEQLAQNVRAFIAEAQKRPEISGLSSQFSANSRQMSLTIDRERIELQGMNLNDVLSTLQTQFGSSIISQYNRDSRVWYVIMQCDPKFRTSPSDIMNLYTRNAAGQMVPLSSVVKTSWSKGPSTMTRFNSLPAALVNGSAAPGYSSGQAIATLKQVAAQTLPQGYNLGWSGLSYEEQKSGATSTLVFAFGLLMVFLILAAQYESLTLPCAVLSAVPFGILGSLLATWARGLENDVYFQIGLLVMVGLAAKNAILIVEFAAEKMYAGLPLKDAALQAGALRLRPIMMTSLAFIGGVIPLAIAVGAGANGRHSISTGIIGGMVSASTLALLFVPLFFVVFESLRKGTKKQAGESVKLMKDDAGQTD